jgi:hypothetical protein
VGNLGVMQTSISRTLVIKGDGLTLIRQGLQFTAAEIERAEGLPRGVVSSVEGGRVYAYPRFRHAVTNFFARETGEPFEEMHERLFPGLEVPAGPENENGGAAAEGPSR